MISLRTLSVLATAVLIGMGCANNATSVDSEAGNPIDASANALITLPSAMLPADGQSGGGLGKTAAVGDDQADDLYSFVRSQAGFINELVNDDTTLSARRIIGMFAAVLPWDSIVKAGTLRVDNADTTVTGSYRESATLPYTASYINPGNEISAAFSGDYDNPKGWVYYFCAQPKNTDTDSLRILVEFEKTGAERTVHVTISQNVKSTSTDSSVGRSFDYTMHQEGNIINLSASSYHPNILLAGDAVGRCYNYTAVIDAQADQAKVSLGLPTGDITSTDTAVLFGTFGIANVYGNAFIKTDLANANDTIKGLVVTSVRNNIGLDSLIRQLYRQEVPMSTVLANAPLAADLTVADLRTYAALNATVGSAADQYDLAAFSWVLKLAQPVYFQNVHALGGYYAGNANDEPEGFSTVKVNCTENPKSPKETMELIVIKP